MWKGPSIPPLSLTTSLGLRILLSERVGSSLRELYCCLGLLVKLGDSLTMEREVHCINLFTWST